MPNSVSTPESKIKKLQIKYAHERDALAWAFDKAFEVAQDGKRQYAELMGDIERDEK